MHRQGGHVRQELPGDDVYRGRFHRCGGIETIIPEAAISNWYDYYRCNGLNLPAIGWQGDDLDILAKYCFSRAKDPEDYASVRRRMPPGWRELRQMRTGTAATTAAGGTCAIT